MKTEFKIAVRAYPVTLKDTRTGEITHEVVVLTKEQLRAGVMFDLGEEDIIYRTYNRLGFRVKEIGKPDKRELTVDLEQLYRDQTELPEIETLEEMGRKIGAPEDAIAMFQTAERRGGNS